MAYFVTGSRIKESMRVRFFLLWRLANAQTIHSTQAPIQKVSEYDQEIPQSNTAVQPMAP